MTEPPPPDGTAIDVLIVGAGPTGLTLAAQLRSCGVRFRIVDRLADRVRESRALAVQARALEVLHGLVHAAGDALERLGVAYAARYLVRPDGHVGFRCAGSALDGVERYLAKRFPPAVVTKPGASLTA